jgi:hypothetical protein
MGVPITTLPLYSLVSTNKGIASAGALPARSLVEGKARRSSWR